jgi:HSP20 family molecular chaperone IbpA
MKKFFFIVLCFFSLSSWAQDADEIVQQFLEQRKKMMEQIMKAFDDDDFFKQDFLDDKMFESIRKQGFEGFKNFKSTGNNIKVEERIEKDGSISVLITPQKKNMKLDIQTTQNQIIIKSEMMESVENENKQGVSKSYSRSSFTQTVAIPQGFEARDPKKEGESILISLVPNKKGNFKPDNKGRVPVQRVPGEETL